MADKPQDPQDYGLKQDKLTMSKLAANYGIAASVFKNNPEIKDVLKQILKLTREGKEPQPEDIRNMLNNTAWFRDYSETYRRVELDRARMSPERWQANLDEQARKIMESFQGAGAEIDEDTARKYAEQMIYGSGIDEQGNQKIYNENWLMETIGDAIDFTKTKTVGGFEMYDMSGAAEETAQLLYKTANDYGIDSAMTNRAFTSWFEKSFKGLLNKTLQPQDVDDELIDLATSRFPGLAKQMAAGQTLRAAANPYLRVLADELELDADTFDLNDDLAQRVLNSVDDSGNFKPVSLYDAKLAARKDERWKFTEQARTEYTDIGNMILRDFGFLG